MLINTKYYIGFKYWVARVYSKYEDDNIIVDGKVYTRKTKVLFPMAKQKEIVGISIEVDSNKKIDISYKIRNVGENGVGFADKIDRDFHEIMFLNRNQAFNYAIDKLNDNKEEYYGAITNNWEHD